MGPKRRRPDPRRPLSMWKESDFFDGKEMKAQVAILATEGCSWHRDSGCTVCGYSNDCPDNVAKEDLMAQVELVLAELDDVESLKVFTSGSFLDPGEVPLGTLAP